MPNYNLKMTQVDDIDITPTQKQYMDSDKIKFSDEPDQFFLGETYSLSGKAKEGFGKVYGFPARYAAKAPWEIFKASFEYLIDMKEGNTLLVEYVRDQDSKVPEILSVKDGSKPVLTLAGIFSEVFINLPETYRVRWIELKGDVVYMDIQSCTDDTANELKGIRLVVDLTLKAGVKLFKLYNVSIDNEFDEDQNELDYKTWRPAVVSEPQKVKTRGMDTMEIYDAIATNINYLSTNEYELQVVDEHASQAFHSEYHVDDHFLVALQSRAVDHDKVNEKVYASSKMYDDDDDYNHSALEIAGWLTGKDITFFKPDQVHRFQTFVGSIFREHELLLNECYSCLNKLEVNNE